MSKRIRLNALVFARFFSYAVGIESIIVGVGGAIYLSLTNNKYELPVDVVLQIDLIILTIFLTMAFVLFYIGNYCSRKVNEIEFAERMAKNEQA